MVQGAWAQGAFGGMPFIPNMDKARVTDVGVAVRDIEVYVKTDSLTQQTDTLLLVADPEMVWQSENVNIYDSLSVDRAMQPRRASRRKTIQDKGIYQSGNMMKDYLSDFCYYVFRFEYPSVDADGNEVILSGIAACPPKESGNYSVMYP